ncbi:alpha/beta hydrolase [Saccharothrix sp. BKS2]|uniref:alpha/beta fold hydrolase n=1 Tax=Saccharothrix sp. BKS2 TaxID=3064400 RepID=UPI0039EB5977
MRYPTRTEGGIRYLEAGPESPTGVTHLLVHGLGGSLEQWTAVVDELRPTTRVVAIDIPGFGHSRTRRGHFAVPDAVRDISGFLDARGIDRCVVVSHSISCVVAAGLAAARPAGVTKLVLVSGALVRASELAQHPGLALRDPALGLAVAAQFAAGVVPVPRVLLTALAASRLLRTATLWPFVASPSGVPTEHLVEALSGSGSLAVLRILLSAHSIDHHRLLAAVEQPVELVVGDRDRLINPSDVARLRAIMRVTRVSVIPDCGHWPWLEKPAELSALITSPERA